MAPRDSLGAMPMKGLNVTRMFPLWQVKTDIPHHHVVRVFSNYPNPATDPDHLIVQINQRTTGSGQSIRLGHAALAQLHRWLRDQDTDSPPSNRYVCVETIGGNVDVLIVTSGMSSGQRELCVTIVHRNGGGVQYEAWADVPWEQAQVLADALKSWATQ